MKHHAPFALALLLSCLALAAPSPREAARVFSPLPRQFDAAGAAPSQAQVDLGRMLYFDKRLSKNHDVSCNSCHQLDRYGVDGEATSPGHKKQRGGRNSPTVYNAGGHLAQFWDGRAATLEAQAGGPILNPVEMAHASEAAVEALLRSIPGYVAAFKKAFPGQKEPVAYAHLTQAIGAFERRLTTPGRFDRFLAGDDKALTPAEQAGLVKFVEVGCTACHLGSAVGGGMYQKYGLVTPVPGLKDTGRFEVTKVEADRFVFKVPSLRNIEKTGPYFHDGAVSKLEDAVSLMAKHQLGKVLTSEETASIVTFLKSLTGELPMSYIAPPKLPPSGKSTPAPDPT